ncbi:MAG: hypothetical protein ABSC72_08025 [Methylovirgula sp.]
MSDTSTLRPEDESAPSHTAGKSCFVIMPFGKKQDIDFDYIHDTIFKPTIRALALNGKRCDEVSKAGLIHKDMIERIISSDVVIVDITTNNPNVFYELGVRHTACRSGTILVRRAGSMIPFNIGSMLVFEYDESTPESIDLARHMLETAIKNSLLEHNIDSLVHTLIPGLNVTRRARPLTERKKQEWRAPNGTKTIGYITGDIANIDFVDVWVNPENTKMQMARAHDDSISAIIRFFGAKRDHTGQVIEDTIVDQLEKQMRRSAVAEAGTVLHTAPGTLGQTNNVKVILHVAAMHGEPGKGFVPIRNHSRCVSAVLKYVDRLNTRFAYRNRLHSILIPLFGSRSAGVDMQDVADAFVRAALEHFEVAKETAIDQVYFLAYTNSDREVCEAAMLRAGLSKAASANGASA